MKKRATKKRGRGRRDVIQVYRSRDGWRWHAVAKNGRIVAESGEAYVTEWRAQRQAARFGPANFDFWWLLGRKR